MDLERDRQAETFIRNEVLEPGEKIAWRGRPGLERVARVGMPGRLIGGLMLAGDVFLIVIAFAVPNMEVVLTPLYGIPLIVLAIAPGVPVALIFLTMSSRRRARGARTYYAITDRRVLIVEAGRSHKVTAYAANDIADVVCEDAEDGSGDIRLRAPKRASGQSYPDFKDGLWGVADVKGAADAVTVLKAA